jgi:valyl-tRNA synthetase
MVDQYPSSEKYIADWSGLSIDGTDNQVRLIQDIITSIRNARSENKVEPMRKIKAVIYAGDKTEMIKEQALLIKSLRTGIVDLEILTSGDNLDDTIYAVVGEVKIYLLGAVDKEKEQARINKEIEKLEKFIISLEAKLNNKEFSDKAPRAVVEKEQIRLAKAKTELANLQK